MPVVLFVPGFAWIAALFPGAQEIGRIERVAITFGLLVAPVPPIAQNQ